MYYYVILFLQSPCQAPQDCHNGRQRIVTNCILLLTTTAAILIIGIAAVLSRYIIQRFAYNLKVIFIQKLFYQFLCAFEDGIADFAFETLYHYIRCNSSLVFISMRLKANHFLPRSLMLAVLVAVWVLLKAYIVNHQNYVI